MIVRAKCPRCDEVVDLSPEEIVLTAKHYRFACPACGVAVKKKTDARIEEMLRDAGVRSELDEESVRIDPELVAQLRQAACPSCGEEMALFDLVGLFACAPCELTWNVWTGRARALRGRVIPETAIDGRRRDASP